jgi:shikimate dehydrogenase
MKSSEPDSYVVGLIGAEIGPSLSPALHEREADQLGLRYVYRRIDITTLGRAPEDVRELVAAAGQLGFSGLNITHPCKQLVVAHLDELSADAKALGAVNTVVFDDGLAIGHNTDWPGFQANFARGLPDVDTDRVVLVGAGGAGAAVAHATLSLGAQRLVVADAAPERADALVASLRARYGRERAVASPLSGLGEALAAADGVINATPAGMEAHDRAAFSPDHLHPGLWVADVVYRPLETELLRQARRLGCRTLDGGGMAVFQAALSFSLFTGREPDRERMLRHFAALIDDAPALAGARS